MGVTKADEDVVNLAAWLLTVRIRRINTTQTLPVICCQTVLDMVYCLLDLQRQRTRSALFTVPIMGEHQTEKARTQLSRGARPTEIRPCHIYTQSSICNHKVVFWICGWAFCEVTKNENDLIRLFFYCATFLSLRRKNRENAVGYLATGCCIAMPGYVAWSYDSGCAAVCATCNS